jgi:hypothetical protein
MTSLRLAPFVVLACGCGFDLGDLRSSTDAGIDAGRDAGEDASVDAGTDGAGSDAEPPEGGTDAEPPDAGEGDSGVPCVPADCDDGNPCTEDFCGPAGCAVTNAPDGTACGMRTPDRDPPIACCGGSCTTLDSATNCGGCGVVCEFGVCLTRLIPSGIIAQCRCSLDATQCPEEGIGWECTMSACECRTSGACADGAECRSEPPYQFCAYPDP